MNKNDFSYRMNQAKVKKERKKKIKNILCCILAILVLLSSTESSIDYLFEKYSAESAVYYFFFYLWAVFYAFAFEPSSEENEKKIAFLERENKILKEKLENTQQQHHQINLFERGDDYEG